MTRYFFQLGHCPDLSHAEILSVNERYDYPLTSMRRNDGDSVHCGADILSAQPNLTSIKSNDGILFAESDSRDTIFHLFDELGGSIRLGEILATHNIENFSLITVDSIFEKLLETKIVSIASDSDQRILFGLSILGTIPQKSKKEIRNLLNELANRLKQYLREKDCSSRFILPDASANRFELNSAQIDKNNLLDKGMEIVLLIDSSLQLSIGMTKKIQSYEAFSQRDYGRPSRDARSGMLPPKLARMMINLARTKDTTTLLDLFCGSGGILMEAGLAGLEATGFDNSDKAVRDSLDNREWLESQYPEITGKVRVFEGDAAMLHTLCEPLYFDTCVTEPYLGPPLKKPLTQEKFDSLAKQLESLYIRALGEIRTVVKPGKRVVFIAPRFRLHPSGDAAKLSLLREIKLLGYTILDPFDSFQPTERRSTLLYERPKQIVLRELFILQT